jgi:hypothetical protein
MGTNRTNESNKDTVRIALSRGLSHEQIGGAEQIAALINLMVEGSNLVRRR